VQHRIAVIRHAKAEQDGPSDAERPLAARGHADAREGGGWLAGQGVTPDRALVSAALRARETWESLAGGAGWDVEAELDRSLYSASPETVLDLLRQLPDEVGTVVVVGHNPTMGIVAQLLDDGSGDAAAGQEMTRGDYPTCSIALFSHEGSWAELDFPSASLTAFHVGRA
jgi:phosphohistidine phosphatase